MWGVFHCLRLFFSITDNTLLSKINQADLQVAHKRDSWTCEVFSALCRIPGVELHISAIMSRPQTNMTEFEPLLQEQVIKGVEGFWPDSCTQHMSPAKWCDSHHFAVPHCGTNFGALIRNQAGWWDDQKRTASPTLPYKFTSFKFDLQPSSLTVQVAGEHQP